ncbi:hypothetical protein HYH02_011946 [Chlamydomonas schloesseri]|uniref:Leucine-binding protein domain-containing protein n=1 Tax=Chlamydomonas schloesseri TaxID=2026947 RepID=A0A835W4E5_9CHLO|nr:hypothetical protein HYH02_011946 [Chlamydomonas schloesseri]|eukprot:KAG2435446.1 hypothetical protein HYH02_011946 [Chlamydomonas schloesseri]
MGFDEEACRFLCYNLPACTLYVWYTNSVCQLRRDAFRPAYGSTGPTDQVVRACVKTEIANNTGAQQGPKEDVYLIRAAGPMPRACPNANLLTAVSACYWTGAFSFKPSEGATQAWIVRKAAGGRGTYTVTNYFRSVVSNPACERNVWNFLPQCGNTDIDMAAGWQGPQQEVFFEPVAGRRGAVRIRAAGRNCTERYLASVLACPGYNSVYWAPLNLRDSAFVFELLPISASYPVPDLPVGMITDSSEDDPSVTAESVSIIHGAYMAAVDRGYKVNLVTSGLGCDSDKIAKEVERLVKEEKVVAIIGPICSGTVLAAAPTINALKVPAISPTAGASAVSSAGPYIYRTLAIASSYVDPLMSYLAPKFPTMAMIYDDSLLGRDWTRLAEAKYKQDGGNVTYKAMISVENGTVAEMEEMTRQALATKPSLLFFMATSSIPAKLELAFIQTARATDPKFPIVMPNGFDQDTKDALEVKDAKGNKTYPLVDGIYYAGDKSYPKATQRYKAMFGLTYMPELGRGGSYASAYDGMSAIIRAAQAAGYSKLKNINKELSSKSFTFERFGGETGRFNADGDMDVKTLLQAYSPITGEPEDLVMEP